MKKTHANWGVIINCYTNCPYCNMPHDIIKHFDYEEYKSEISEETLDDLIINCDYCHKDFGINHVYND